ncbi:MAG TPA: hypothetical protein VGM78_06660 [Ilumatobacteraceae bacterium]
MTEWNASDPDAAKVFYDLAEWDFDQQAELAAALAESEIPHGWDGTELVIPGEYEEATDSVFAEVEQRLEVMGKKVPVGGEDDEGSADDADDGERVIATDTVLTEYDLAEWDELERSLVEGELAANNIPFRWETFVLLVPTSDEAKVDAILDMVESGEVIPVIDDGPDGDVLPFESLNSFFLAGERLRKNPLDADGLERLLDALKIANPNRPPEGVELKTWRQICRLAEALADSLADNDAGELEEAQAVAGDLHDLLRPLI